MNNPTLSIVVVSCDAYSDIVKQYLHYLHLNWPDCEYPVYVAMEKADLESSFASTVVCGSNTTWTQRAIQAIKTAGTDYVLLSVDDLFISEKVNSSDFKSVVQFIGKEKIKYYRIPVLRLDDKKETYPGNPNVELIERNKRYNVSIGTAIWDKNEILSILGDGAMSAWDLENYFLLEAEKAKPGYLDGYVSDKRYLLHSVHMIKSGKWIPAGVNEMKRKGYSLSTAERGFISFGDRLKLNWFYSWCSKNLPTGLRNKVKAVMKKFGFKFASR